MRRKISLSTALILIVALIVSGCGAGFEGSAEKKGASESTVEANQEFYNLLDFDDNTEMEFAEKGLIYSPDSLTIKTDEGKVVWSQDQYNFVQSEEVPDTANPSLWRNTQINNIYGLFEVTDGIYQVRGYDTANITFIEGDTGWIVFDPLGSAECAEEAMKVVDEHLGEKPIKAIVISHPHVDHYQGIKGIVSEEEVKENNIPIIVPENFAEHAVSENVYVGNAMVRRATYQYGSLITKGAMGALGIGIGMSPSGGTGTYISPTDEIKETGEVRTIDGVNMEFMMAPNTEAPAEMFTWFADKKALWMAEDCTATLHNLYTLRGAQVRDGNAWAGYIMEALARYGEEAEVAFQSHNWPHWGNEFVKEYLENNAAIYKFINDQTLMYMNEGYTSTEISNMIELPAELEKVWYTRQYYGTISHNARAVYQRFLGYYDANPVNLNPIEPTERAKKFVEYLGDTDRVLEMAKEDFDKGEYRWVAEITSILVYADPENMNARYLCADALEQLGYQSESGTWRASYLSAASDLRTKDPSSFSGGTVTGNTDILKAMTPEMAFDQIGILFDCNKGQDLNMKINFNFSDGSKYLVTVKSGVVLYQKNNSAADADATVSLPASSLYTIIGGEPDMNSIKITGDKEALNKLIENFAEFNFMFNIVIP